MDEGGYRYRKPFRTAIKKWKHVGEGAVDRNGRVITIPPPLAMAQLIDGLCQRYGCLPSQLLKEDARIIKMVTMVHEGEDKDKDKLDGK